MSVNRKTYMYKTVMYKLSDYTDEFINVGVIVYSENNKKEDIKLLSSEEIEEIAKCSFINSKYLKNILPQILKAFKSNKVREEFWQNYIRFSSFKMYTLELSFEEVLFHLYERKVSYKIKNKNAPAFG